MTRKKTHEEFLREVADCSRGEYEVVSEYVNSKTKVMFLHKECGNIFEMNPLHFVNRGQRCPAHKNERISKAKTKNKKTFAQELSEIRPDLMLLSDYKGTKEKIKVKGSCGHTWVSQAGNLLHSKSGCPVCKGHKDTTAFAMEMVSLYQGEFEVLGEYVNNNEPITVKHICGEIFDRSPKKLLQSGGCPKCGQSKGEMMVQRWLLDHGIAFERQFRINECRNINPLPFDFKANHKTSGETVLIEIDGQQHYNASNFWGRNKEEAYAKLLKNDSIKNEYCEVNGIKLLRLPYWWFRNDRYKRELSNALLSN